MTESGAETAAEAGGAGALASAGGDGGRARFEATYRYAATVTTTMNSTLATTRAAAMRLPRRDAAGGALLVERGSGGVGVALGQSPGDAGEDKVRCSLPSGEAPFSTELPPTGGGP
jgi:hypothetical protein